MLPNKLVKGDSGSVLEVLCNDDATNSPIDLTGMTVELKYRIAGGALKTRTMTIVTPQAGADKGKATYQFTAADDLYASGEFVGDVRVIDGSSRPITNLDQIKMMVREPIS